MHLTGAFTVSWSVEVKLLTDLNNEDYGDPLQFVNRHHIHMQLFSDSVLVDAYSYWQEVRTL